MMRDGMCKSALWLLALVASLPLAAARAETIDQLYEKAKLEKALVIYTGAGPSTAQAMASAFEKRFPGITVAAKGGFSNVLDLEIDQQIKDGNITVDYTNFQTAEDYQRWDKEGVLLHFKPEGFDQVPATMKAEDGAWVAVSAVPLFYGYNPDKVQPAEVPISALDFLKPQFRGKIVTAYPADDDATLYDFYLIVEKYGWDYMKKYMANQANFVQGHRDVAASVKAGTNFLSFDVSNGSQAAGPGPAGALKVVMSAKDRTPVFFVSGAILKKALHPNAAKLFLSWALSKEQQGRSPVAYSPRRDIPPPAGMPPLTSSRFANGYRDFVDNDKRMADLRKRFEAMTGPVTNKATVQ
jgi:ABC-type Fe3+ transport system substrate-binding protein